MANERRLIDANALMKKPCNKCPANIQEDCKVDPACATMMRLLEAPAVDAVEVVRCVNCKHYEKCESSWKIANCVLQKNIATDAKTNLLIWRKHNNGR